MFKEAFEKLELETVTALLEELNPHFEGIQFEPGATTILGLKLDFYPGYQLLDISNHTVMPPIQRFAIYKPGDCTVIDFTNTPIYALNKNVPIQLTQENVGEYVHFFFTYIRGRHGRFLIAENVDDITWKDDPPPSARKAMGKMIVPITLNSLQNDGSFKLSVSMMFKDSLFKSDVLVTKEGYVSLENEELLVEDIPVLDDTLGQ